MGMFGKIMEEKGNIILWLMLMIVIFGILVAVFLPRIIQYGGPAVQGLTDLIFT